MAAPKRINRYTGGQTSGCALHSFEKVVQKLRRRGGAQTARKKLKLIARQGAGGKVRCQKGVCGTRRLEVKLNCIAAAQQQLQIACIARIPIRTVQVAGMVVVKIRDEDRAQHQRDERGCDSLHDMFAN